MTTTPYCTLAEVRAELLATTVSASDDIKLMGLIRQVSARIDRKFWSFAMPFFVPTLATLNVPIDPTKIISWNRTLRLPFPLLSVSSVTIGNTTLTVGTNVRLYPPLSSVPYFTLQLINNFYSWYALAYQCGGCAEWQQQFVTITGVWGFNPNPANMWLAVDALAAGINSSVTSLTVADIDGANPYGITPRISAGNLIQIDSEWMLVTATDTATNTATVLRGQNGSTAAAHLASAVVSVYQVDENIRRVARQVCLQYARRGAFNTSNTSDGANVEFPPDVIQELNGVLQLFANLG